MSITRGIKAHEVVDRLLQEATDKLKERKRIAEEAAALQVEEERKRLGGGQSTENSENIGTATTTVSSQLEETQVTSSSGASIHICCGEGCKRKSTESCVNG
jgi:regulator of replication initiation timing